MLVLSRKKNESIVINGNITIEVLQIRGKQIRLGISAPNSVKILRAELPTESASNEPPLKSLVDKASRQLMSKDETIASQDQRCHDDFHCAESPVDYDVAPLEAIFTLAPNASLSNGLVPS